MSEVVVDEIAKLEARLARVEARPHFFPWGRCKPWTGKAPDTYRLVGGITDIPHCSCRAYSTKAGVTTCSVHGRALRQFAKG